MLQPVGPLSPEVYWRRRLVVVGGLIVVLLLCLALCSFGGGGGGGTPNGQGTKTPGGGASTSGGSTGSASSGAEPTLTVSSGQAGGPAQGSGGGSNGSGSNGAGGSGASGSGTGTGSGGGSGSGSGTPGAGASGTAAVIKACPDSSLSIGVKAAKTAYKVGDTPVLELTMKNVGTVACTRDIGAKQQEILLYSGKTRVWSSNDCYPEGTADVQTLQPGQTVTSQVTWSGLASQPGCAGSRPRVQAGSYQLVGQLASAKTPKPGTLKLTK